MWKEHSCPPIIDNTPKPNNSTMQCSCHWRQDEATNRREHWRDGRLGQRPGRKSNIPSSWMHFRAFEPAGMVHSSVAAHVRPECLWYTHRTACSRTRMPSNSSLARRRQWRCQVSVWHACLALWAQLHLHPPPDTDIYRLLFPLAPAAIRVNLTSIKHTTDAALSSAGANRISRAVCRKRTRRRCPDDGGVLV